MSDDPRRRIPRTDTLLADPRFAAAAERHGRDRVRAAITTAQEAARSGEIAPEDVAGQALSRMPAAPSSLRRVINATGVVVHTNLGRAPLSEAAVEAVAAAAGYTDVEFDLATGARARRGAAALDALLERVPEAGSALVVNNGAAALVLATTALAQGKEVVVSRGELIEIGDGFRLPELIASTGARLREVGTTNRTHLRDYAEAVGPDTGCILKAHPSNFAMTGFTSGVGVDELSTLGAPVVADIGSGLLAPEPTLPAEPDARTWLREGASIVTASGDKLLGGPQAGIVLGDAAIVERLRRHPLARALRVDKLTLAALEATVAGPTPPVLRAIRATANDVAHRTRRIAEALGTDVVEVDGRVGGGGAPGIPLSGMAIALPAAVAERLRLGTPPVVARVADGRCLVDLRCVPEPDDDALLDALRAALG
ncbi:L-seryl-tRNA(Sec) selenium transferase [Calidifontibacter sp. DB0510]|uniref:L-seryl-tRNA(Sec) selenium transferase n=1 Tax=Metallococcus carri TaxID=1656884 RepID=A0A967B4A1_9MICO|nr:L-seryl-tRNA(Sec) selenium transferase [Metallococcus carri]NHN57268.1 L-seryl-tRNA(Sec) selenium transferase [Metallococcus carri]NOP38127.1 L-seryl-tRNA(Sec) selenium transferase [Calidifontibacter sp. DB2511S]